MIDLDILGQAFPVSAQAAAHLRDLAAAEAGQSASARDLSFVLNRALQTNTRLALQRGEARALLQLLAAHAGGNEELTALERAIQSTVAKR